THHPNMDCCIFAAAVADYAPVHPSSQKIKKKEDYLKIELEKNIDIAATLGTMKRPNQIHVGFALETENEVVNAGKKLKAKNFDLIVLNSLKDEGAGFQHDTNQVTFIQGDGEGETSGLLPKTQVARLIVGKIKNMLP